MLELNSIKNLLDTTDMQIKYKNTHWLMKYYNKDGFTAWGKTIWVPSKSLERTNPHLVMSMLAHEYIHYMDSQKYGIKYNLRYWFSSYYRLLYEMEAYKANILILLYFYNEITKDQVDELAEILASWHYMYMIEKRVAVSMVKNTSKRLLKILNGIVPNHMSPALKNVLDLLKECRNEREKADNRMVGG